MPIQLNCPNCSRPLRVPDSLVGRKVKCTNCQTVFTASTGDEPLEPPPTQPEESIRSEVAVPRRSQRREPPRDDYDDERRDGDYYDEEPRRRSEGRPHRGGMVLTFGILGLLGGLGTCIGVFCCFFWVSPVLSLPFGIMAWVMGHSDLKEMKDGRMDPSGRGSTQAGYIMGIVAVVLTIVDIILSIISAFLGLAMQAVNK